MKNILIIGLIIFLWQSISAQFIIDGQLRDSLSTPLSNTEVFLIEKGCIFKSDSVGKFFFENLNNGDYSLIFTKEGYASKTVYVKIENSNLNINIILQPLEFMTATVNINASSNMGLEYFRSVDWDYMIIGASKKSELIYLDRIEGNLAANNSRHIYAKVAGLNIWENDNSGIQLNIGARGLSPNRTSNFNTRQNGYDIAADALGYPETYYTPPAQALERIEIIRGAASLQYGTQFGGLLNFRIKNGDKNSPFVFSSENTYGSFNFFNSFNSIGGTTNKGKLNYYAYYQYKRGNGWRPFSEFNVHNAYATISYQLNKKLSLKFEQTSMHYLARQPGGLTDLEFNSFPRQSKRPRNWFKVNWNISSLDINYNLSGRTKLNFRNFILWSDRQSLGNLSPINRVDYGAERDLIKGLYRNFGHESRILHRFQIGKKVTSIFLGGIRLYKGFTEQQQGFSNADSSGTREDFNFNSTNNILRSDYKFPSFNAAIFAENYFSLGEKFSITPGIRYEFIQTKAEGYYQNLLVVPSPEGFDTLRNEAIFENRSLPRSIFLVGIGGSYRPSDNLEIYANFSQNYRAVNFNDMRIINPNQEIDPNLKDESGFNADFGFRGRLKNILSFDISLFYLSYKERIGNLTVQRPDPENPTINELITLRTNIGNARVFGVESLFVWDVLSTFLKKNTDFGLQIFTNTAFLDGRYLKTENSFASGKKLELVSPLTFKSGVNFNWKKLKFNYQFSYTAAHFSDATNSKFSPNAVVGEIPNYYIMDLSLSYTYKIFSLQIGCNNFLNEMYFTRRAASYPGPGIIPADGRNFYISLKTTLGMKKSN